MSQLHKRFTSEQVKELLERYLRNEIERKHLQEILGIKEKRFFALVRQYRENPHHFSIQYHRASPPRISEALEKKPFSLRQRPVGPIFFLTGNLISNINFSLDSNCPTYF